MKMTKTGISTMDNSFRDKLYARTNPLEFTQINVIRLDFNATDGDEYEVLFITDTDEVHKEIYYKNSYEKFSKVDDNFFYWNIQLTNPLYFEDSTRSLSWEPEKHKFRYRIYPLNFNDDEERYTWLDSFSVEFGKNEITVNVPSDYCLNSSSEYRRLHYHHEEITANGERIRCGSYFDKIRVDQEEIEELQRKFSDIKSYCTERNIKIAFDTEYCKFIAGRYDDLSYDDYDDSKDEHFSTGYLQQVSDYFDYAGCDYEFVIKGAKVKKEEK